MANETSSNVTEVLNKVFKVDGPTVEPFVDGPNVDPYGDGPTVESYQIGPVVINPINFNYNGLYLLIEAKPYTVRGIYSK